MISVIMSISCTIAMFNSLIEVIAFINEMQVFIYDNSNFIYNPHIFTSMYIQRVFIKKPSLCEAYPYIYIYLSCDYMLILLVVS